MMKASTVVQFTDARQYARAVIRLTADHVRRAPGRDWGPESTIGDAFADVVLDLIDRLDDPDVRRRLDFLLSDEAARS